MANSQLNAYFNNNKKYGPIGDWYGWGNNERRNFANDILFQIAYTLLVFKDFGLMHNDLHAGNIFVEPLATPLRLTYGIKEGVIRTREVNFFVRIFDFDRSSVTPRDGTFFEQNTKLSSKYCKMFGQCNTFRPNADWFSILHTLYKISDNSFLFLSYLPEDLSKLGIRNRRERTGHHGKLVALGYGCICDNDQCSTCTPATFEDIVTPMYYLTNLRGEHNFTPDYVLPSMNEQQPRHKKIK